MEKVEKSVHDVLHHVQNEEDVCSDENLLNVSGGVSEGAYGHGHRGQTISRMRDLRHARQVPLRTEFKLSEKP